MQDPGTGRELLQYTLRLLHGGCSGQPQFRDHAALEGSRRPLHTPFGLRRQSEYQFYPQFIHCLSELGWRAGGLIFRLHSVNVTAMMRPGHLGWGLTLDVTG